MRNCYQLACAVVLLSGLSVSTWADSTQASALLDQMSRSFRELNYQGAFSYQQGENTQSLKITHAVIDGEEYERLEYMDGDRREIIRRGHDLTCIHPGHELVRFYQNRQNLKQSTDLQGSKYSDLTDYYELSVVESGRIAGRDVVEVLVSPKDTHRYVHRLSLDKETGLLLRSIVVGSAGKVLERFQFADIHIGDNISREHFKQHDYSYSAAHVGPANSASEQLSTVGERQWSVNWLPGGYTTIATNQKLASDDMATFTDGLSVFSVFLEKIDNKVSSDSGGEGHARRGATVAYSRAMVLSGKPHRVTVVGEIPQQTARQVAQSVALSQ